MGYENFKRALETLAGRCGFELDASTLDLYDRELGFLGHGYDELVKAIESLADSRHFPSISEINRAAGGSK